MTTDHDDRLRAALRADAERAPLATPEWQGPRYDAAALRRRPALLAAAAAVTLAAAVVGAAIAASVRGGVVAAGDRPSFLRGEEYALLPADATTIGSPGLIRPDSVRAARLPDIDVVVTSYETAFDSLSLRQRCVSLPNGTSCLETSQPALVAVSQLSMPGTSDSVWIATWDNLPPGTAYVQFVDPDGTARWQRPLGSTAVFRASANMPMFKAFDVDGHEIPYPTTNVVPEWLPPSAAVAVAAGRAAAEACLARPGATWEDCVEEGRIAAEAAVGG